MWPEHEERPLDLGNAADRRHLRTDAIDGEDFAIGHADANAGREGAGLPDGYDRRRERCMASVFSLISARHQVSADVVAQYRLRRNRVADAAVIGSFGLLYVMACYLAAGSILRRFRSDPIAAVTAAIVTSLALGWACMMLGEVWSIFMEVARLGRGHLSYRTARIPWVQYRLYSFLGGVIAFLVIAALRYRRGIPDEAHTAAIYAPRA